MKKIIIVCHDCVAPLIGGGGVRVLNIAKGFNKKGYNVLILAPSELNEICGIDVRRLHYPNTKKNILIEFLKFNLHLFFQLKKNIDETEFIFVHNAISLPAVIIFASVFRKKVFLEVADIHSQYIKMRGGIYSLRFISALFSLFEYKLISLANKIIAVTNQMKLHLVSYGLDEKKIYVAYDGVDIENFSIDKNRDSYRKIVHLGLVNVHSGVKYLVKSFVHVVEKHKDVVLYIIGDGAERQKCEGLAKELKMEKNIIFRNFETHDLIGDILKDYSIGIIPRTDTIGNNIVMTLKLLEYWASGIAIVASRLKGIQEVAKDNCNILFVNPGDERDLANNILALLEDTNKVNRLALEGRNSAKLFSWESAVNKTIDICVSKEYNY